MLLGHVAQCWRYPVKSMQGAAVDAVGIGSHGVAGDRAHALQDVATGRVLSAKSVKELLDAVGDGRARCACPTAPSSTSATRTATDGSSDWLGRAVTLLSLEQSGDLTYEMTFDPPDDDAEYFEIPLPEHGFVDLAPLHLIATSTLAACAARAPGPRLGRAALPPEPGDRPRRWRLRRGRVGRRAAAHRRPVRRVDRPADGALRDAAASPAGDRRGAGAGRASRSCTGRWTELHEAHPNHLGVYVGVVVPGACRRWATRWCSIRSR